MANAQRGNRRFRKRGEPSWYDRSMADIAGARQPDVTIGIPEDKVGLIIGRKGLRLREIKEQSRARVVVIDNEVQLTGTPEQCEKAKKIIGEILNSVSIEGSSWRKRGKFEKSNSLKSRSNDLVWLAISSPEPDFVLASSIAGSSACQLLQISTFNATAHELEMARVRVLVADQKKSGLWGRDLDCVHSLWKKKGCACVKSCYFVFPSNG